MAKIICGANELEDVRWDGKTIEQVRCELKTVLNPSGNLGTSLRLSIPEDSKILLNGTPQDQTGIALRSDDELEFVKAAGEKG